MVVVAELMLNPGFNQDIYSEILNDLEDLGYGICHANTIEQVGIDQKTYFIVANNNETGGNSDDI